MEKNKFIEKFKNKTKSELEHINENPSLYQKEAIEATKILLEKYNEKRKTKSCEKEKIQELLKNEPIYKEKAFFKYKWMYWIVFIYTLIASIFSLWIMNEFKGIDSINFGIWGIINLIAFIVIISKHKKTLLYLKILSLVSLIYIAYRYAYTYLNLAEDETIEFLSKDIKFLVLMFIIIFAGDKLIETRKINIRE